MHIRFLWLIPAILGLVALFAGLVGRKKAEKEAAARAQTAPTPAATAVSKPAKRFSLVDAVRLLLVALLAWWLGSSIYKWAKTPKIPKTPTSGIFVLKAGGGLVQTGIFSQPGQWERYEQMGLPKNFWRKNNDGHHLEITSQTFTVEVTQPGEIQLIPGPEDATVRVRLTKSGSLFPFSQ